jgi:hypothetical protein
LALGHSDQELLFRHYRERIAIEYAEAVTLALRILQQSF